jgi:2-polyprenyl-3-methyl-5-hydroxy-6-metoxy-1,4-benzoquinol methylase
MHRSSAAADRLAGSAPGRAGSRRPRSGGETNDRERALPTEPGACALCGHRGGIPLATGPDFEYDTTRAELRFWRCPCGGVYLDPRPAPEALGRIYPPTYYAYEFAQKLGSFVMRFKAFAERAKVRAYEPYLAAGARVLDVGCGDGHLLADLRSACPFTLVLEGVDFSPDAAAAAERNGFKVYQGRVEEIELPARAFDLIIMNQLIEHMPEPLRVLEAVARALRPGGHLFIETPNLDSLDARLFRRRYWGGYHLPRHFHLFDTRSLPELVRMAGLKTVSLRPLVCPQFWIISMHNWMCDLGQRKLATRLFSPFNPLWLAPFTLIELVQQRVWWTSNLQLVATEEA